MPVAMPTCRNVLLIPAAIPLMRGSTTPTAVEASGGLISPMPTPATQKPGSSADHPDVVVNPGMSRSGAPARTSPPPEEHRIGSPPHHRPGAGPPADREH